MSTLHNFASPNAGSATVKFYPDLHLRQEWLKKNLNHPRAWDIPNLVPIGPMQRRDLHVLDGSHVDPQVTEHRHKHVSHMYVPLKPYTRVIQGDTADGRLLMEGKKNKPLQGWNMNGTHLPIWSHSPFAAY
jgi:hypothetical protein